MWVITATDPTESNFKGAGWRAGGARQAAAFQKRLLANRPRPIQWSCQFPLQVMTSSGFGTRDNVPDQAGISGTVRCRLGSRVQNLDDVITWSGI